MAVIGTQPMIESFIAGADLTANQFFAVMLSTSANKVLLATGGSGPVPVGILLNSPSSGQAAEVLIWGKGKLACDGSTAIGVRDFLTINASGRGAVGTGSFFHAQALEGLSSGCAIVEVLWTPNSLNPGDNTP